MFEIHVAEGGQRPRTRHDHGQDALPGRHRQGRVAILEIAVSQVDQMPRVPAPLLRETLEHAQGSALLSDAPIEVRESREHVLVASCARFEVGHQRQSAGSVAPLKERFTLLEDKLGAVGRRPNQPRVLGNRAIELTVGLEQAHHANTQLDLSRVDRERTPIRGDGASAVTRLFVEASQKRQACEVARVLAFDLLDEHGHFLISAVQVRDRLVDLRTKRALLPRDLETRLRVFSASSLRWALACARPSSLRAGANARLSPVAAPTTSRSSGSARSNSPRFFELPAELPLDEQAGRLERSQGEVELLGAIPVFLVERQPHQRSQRLLLVGEGRKDG